MTLKQAIQKKLQFSYLVISEFSKNSLDLAAAACAFNFVFSSFPIILMILTIFVYALRMKPNVMNFVIQFFQTNFSSVVKSVDLDQFILRLTSGIRFGVVNIMLSIFIVWMSRKLFLSVVRGVSAIFKSEQKRSSLFNQTFTFVAIILVVILSTVVFLCAFLTRQIFSLPIFSGLNSPFSFIFGSIPNIITNAIFYVILFIFTFSTYRFASRTHPPLRLCFFFSSLCIITFAIGLSVIVLVINKTNYNTIYGMLSNLVIILLEIYMFFFCFFIFAEGLYVSQFKKELFFSRIYLASGDESGVVQALRKQVFSFPLLIIENCYVGVFEKNTYIKHFGDTSPAVYFVISGCILKKKLQAVNGENISFESHHYRGEVLCEVECFTGEMRNVSLFATEKTTILKVSKEEFLKLSSHDLRVSNKLLSKLQKKKQGKCE